MFVDNVGVAPIYRPYRLAFRFRQGNEAHIVLSSADLRSWMPDHTWFSDEIVFPPALQRGETKVDIGLVDAATLAPRVRFAIEEALPDGWHPMTSLHVV